MVEVAEGAGTGAARAMILPSPCWARVLGDVPSHRHLFDAKVSCLCSRSGNFRPWGASVEERLEENKEWENDLFF